MKIAIVGCGYVFDTYMTTLGAHPELSVCGVFDIDHARAEIIGRRYGFHVYPNIEALHADLEVSLALNLTSIESHYEVTRGLLEAGKHVYSEKPLTTDLDQARALFDLAAANGLTLAGAPCNFLCDTVQTMWRAVRDGAIGKPLLVYAEFDDNPIYLMNPEEWRSRTGAPWPYKHEYEQGCTFEHVGYHLVWMLAMLGPAVSVTAFSKQLVANKTRTPLEPPDTPDFSVGCINFQSGAAARVTCSIVAPADHRMRVIGDEGEISTNTYRQYQSPVMLERFSSLSLNARKARSVRIQPLLGHLFGVGGQSLPLVRHDKSHASQKDAFVARAPWYRRLAGSIKRQEVDSQDKVLGLAATVRAIREGRPCPIPPDFILHSLELTLAIQRAGVDGAPVRLTTTFAPLEPIAEVTTAPRDYRVSHRGGFVQRQLETLISRLHKH